MKPYDFAEHVLQQCEQYCCIAAFMPCNVRLSGRQFTACVNNKVLVAMYIIVCHFECDSYENGLHILICGNVATYIAP